MIHLGDITKINGAEIEPVDCITAGSPCQDLSVAGKRAGLEGERSGLFMEQIRIIKEMREHDRNNGRTDEFIRPRYMVWENVPGAFSSNKGEDFRCVIEETAKVAERDAVIPGPPKGKWSKSGAIMGDGWSIAWRVHDAQFWGVPQRRKRISLVADFGGESAPEILFERKGLSGNIAESRKEGKGITTDAEAGTNQTIGFNRERCGAVTMLNKMPTLQAAAGESGNNQPMVVLSFQERAWKPGGGKGILIQNERTGALSTLNNQSVCCLNDQGGSQMGVTEDGQGWAETEVNDTLNAFDSGETRTPTVVVEGFDNYNISLSGETAKTLQSEGGGSGVNEGCVLIENHPQDSRVKISEDGVVQTLSKQMGTGGGYVPMVMESIGGEVAGTLDASYYKGCGMRQGMERTVVYGFTYANDAYDKWSESEKGASLRASGGVYGGGSESLSVNSAVRRLTPLECERLQGYPDNWTNIGDWIDSKGKKHKGDADSPRYKALGNSIALPFWFYLLRRISAQYERPATLGSLFDGIGGFPLCWERCNGKGTARWASEIEEFPIAVTRRWFGE